MAAAWVHSTHDIVAFGRSYFDLHKRKDTPRLMYGSEHRWRDEYHDWYRAFGRLWTWSEPIPEHLRASMRAVTAAEGAEAGEEYQAWIAHDMLDRTWDLLSGAERM